MKKAITVLACVCALAGGAYLAASKWAIRHEALTFFDAARQRPIAVDLAVRRDYEMKANAVTGSFRSLSSATATP